MTMLVPARRRIVGTLAKRATRDLVTFMASKPFALATDGSNDKSGKQIYPIVVWIHNGHKVVTEVLSVASPDASTGQGIFNMLTSELKKYLNCDRYVFFIYYSSFIISLSNCAYHERHHLLTFLRLLIYNVL